MQAPPKGLTVRMRASSPAQTTTPAAALPHIQLPLCRKPFRIMAPHTPQRTALQKHRRPQARSVVHGHFLNIKNHAHSQHISSALRRRALLANCSSYKLHSLQTALLTNYTPAARLRDPDSTCPAQQSKHSSPTHARSVADSLQDPSALPAACPRSPHSTAADVRPSK